MDANQIIVYAAVANHKAVDIEKNNKPLCPGFSIFDIGFIKKDYDYRQFLPGFWGFFYAENGLDKP